MLFTTSFQINLGCLDFWLLLFSFSVFLACFILTLSVCLGWFVCGRWTLCQQWRPHREVFKGELWSSPQSCLLGSLGPALHQALTEHAVNKNQSVTALNSLSGWSSSEGPEESFHLLISGSFTSHLILHHIKYSSCQYITLLAMVWDKGHAGNVL